MRNEIEARAKKAMEEGVFPGCVVGIIRANSSREIFPFGDLTYEPDSARVTEDTIYDVASITKSIPTASLALSFVAEGRLGLGDTVFRYLPELRSDYGATVEDLLRYRVQGPTLSTLKDKTADELTAYVFAHGFKGPAGKSRYTNLPAFLLGLIVERVGGDTLDALTQKYFFDPLGMKNTAFFPNYRPRRSIAPTEIVDGMEIRGIVHDESARVFARAGLAVGHAGLFSTAPDILKFLEALLQEKYPNVLDGAQKGLGWQVNDARFMGRHAHPRTFGKTGFTGTSCVVNAERGVALVILSNRTYPTRPSDGRAIDAFRGDIADVVLE